MLSRGQMSMYELNPQNKRRTEGMNDIQTTNNQLAKGYLITPQQFIDDDYAAKIARDECEVFLYHEPPPPDASESEKWAYRQMVQDSGNVTEIVSVSHQGNGYYFLDTN